MNKKKRSRLWIYFAGIIFTTVLAVFSFITFIWLALFQLDLIQTDPGTRHIPIALLLLGSVLLGTIIALFVGKLIIRPIQDMRDAFNELSRGNFSVRMPTDQKITEIQEMARDFNAMVHDLAHTETLRNDFVANVSHEFKTPIAAIEGYATLLQNPGLTQEKHNHYIRIILDNSRRLTSLSSDILTLSKLENQEMLVDKRKFRLDEQLRRSILTLEGKWSRKNIQFDMDLPNQMYYGSETLLSQVWINILDNAIKHSPDGGTICVTIQSVKSEILVSVSDHGEGMSAETLKHIFEKFYQGDDSRQAEGNGLGLALVKRILDLSHGSITVDSSPGRGTTFFVHLPVYGDSVL